MALNSPDFFNFRLMFWLLNETLKFNNSQNDSDLVALASSHEKAEKLPDPAELRGGNYVAYIPIPHEKPASESENYFYYEDDVDNNEHHDDDDDVEFEYVEYVEIEEKDEPKRKRIRKRPTRRKFEPSRKKHKPFIVPLMVVPEDKVGVLDYKRIVFLV